MVAALFALHPINVESVAWVAELKNLLSMFFLLLALGAYRWYARQPRVGRYVVVACLFALGLMAKPQVITLPFVFLAVGLLAAGRMFASGPESAIGTATRASFQPRGSFLAHLGEGYRWASFAASAVHYHEGAAGGRRRLSWAYPVWTQAGTRSCLTRATWGRRSGRLAWPSSYPHPGNLRSAAGWSCFALLLLLAITALVAVNGGADI